MDDAGTSIEDELRRSIGSGEVDDAGGLSALPAREDSIMSNASGFSQPEPWYDDLITMLVT